MSSRKKHLCTCSGQKFKIVTKYQVIIWIIRRSGLYKNKCNSIRQLKCRIKAKVIVRKFYGFTS